MAWFAVETVYTDDRDALAAAGPWADDTAGFAIYRVADRAELDRLFAEDPYTTEGVAASRAIHEWKLVLGQWAQ